MPTNVFGDEVIESTSEKNIFGDDVIQDVAKVDYAARQAVRERRARASTPTAEEAPTTLTQRAAGALKRSIVPSSVLIDAWIGKGDPQVDAAAQGALDTILAGTPEAIAKRSGASLDDAEAAKFKAPFTYAVGQTAGALLPLGELSKGGQLLKQGIGRMMAGGARLGAVYGAGAGVSEASKKDDASVGEAVTEGGKGAALGAVVGATIPVGIRAFVGTGKLAVRVAENIKNVFSPGREVLIRQAVQFPVTKGKNVPKLIQDSSEALADDGAKVEDMNSYHDSVVSSRGRVAQELGQLNSQFADAKMNVTGILEDEMTKLLKSNPRLQAAKMAQDEIPKLQKQMLKLETRLQNAPPSSRRAIQGQINGVTQEIENLNRNAQLGRADLEKVQRFMDFHQGEKSVEDANHMVQILNGELESELKRRDLNENNLVGHPDLQAMDRIRYQMKEALIRELDGLSGDEQTRRLRDQYKALTEMQELITKRLVVMGRLRPVNLTQGMALVHGVGGGLEKAAKGEPVRGAMQAIVEPMIANKVRKFNSPDDEIRRAFEMQTASNPQAGQPPSLTPIQRKAMLEILMDQLLKGSVLTRSANRINPSEPE